MTDEERQHTMDFILEQQAAFAAAMQRREESDVRADKRLNRLERTVGLLARQFRRERSDLRERIGALVDAQIKTEEITRHNSEDIKALIAASERNSEEISALAAASERNSEEINALTKLVAKVVERRNGDEGGA